MKRPDRLGFGPTGVDFATPAHAVHIALGAGLDQILRARGGEVVRATR